MNEPLVTEPGDENLRGCRGIMYGCVLSAAVWLILGGLAYLVWLAVFA